MALIVAASFAILSVTAQRVVTIPVRARSHAAGIAKRDSYGSATINNYMPLGGYFATVQIGTPPQTMELLVSTVHSETWVFEAGGCNVTAVYVCEGGDFNSASSSTFQMIAAGNFSVSSPWGGDVLGDYVTDDLSIAGLNVRNFTIGLASQANSSNTGVLGLGLEGNISQDEYDNVGDSITALNLIDNLYQQGAIGSRSFSVCLEFIDSATGTLIFGGYDTAKFTDDLTIMPMQGDWSYSDGNYDVPFAPWTSMSFSNMTGTFDVEAGTEFPMAAAVDTSTTLSYIPNNLFDILAPMLNATYDDDRGLYIVPCNQPNSTVNFGLGGPDGRSIPVPFAELAVPYYYYSGAIIFENGTDLCEFGLQPADGGAITLGLSFMRSAYVLFDYDNLLLGFAPVLRNSGQANIVEYTGSAQRIVNDTTAPNVTVAWSVLSTATATPKVLLDSTTSSFSYFQETFLTSQPASLTANLESGSLRNSASPSTSTVATTSSLSTTSAISTNSPTTTSSNSNPTSSNTPMSSIQPSSSGTISYQVIASSTGQSVPSSTGAVSRLGVGDAGFAVMPALVLGIGILV